MKNFFRNKAVGFYLCLVNLLLMIVADIIYAISYADFLCNGYTAISWEAFTLLIVGVVASVFLYFFKLEKYIHYCIAFTCGIGLLFFIQGIYMYVSVMAYGIDASFNGTFYLNCVMFAMIFVLSFANIFIKQTKDEFKEVKE